MIFDKILHYVREKKKLEQRRKEVKPICDFLNFLKVGGLKCFVESDFGGDVGVKMLEVDLSPEQIDEWLVKFYEVYDKIRG